MIFVVEYTNEDCVGNECLKMEIEASDLNEAWEILDENYSDLCIDQVCPK